MGTFAGCHPFDNRVSAARCLHRARGRRKSASWPVFPGLHDRPGAKRNVAVRGRDLHLLSLPAGSSPAVRGRLPGSLACPVRPGLPPALRHGDVGGMADRARLFVPFSPATPPSSLFICRPRLVAGTGRESLSYPGSCDRPVTFPLIFRAPTRAGMLLSPGARGWTFPSGTKKGPPEGAFVCGTCSCTSRRRGWRTGG